MKRLVFTALICFFTAGVFAQVSDTVKTTTDTTVVKVKKKKFKLGFGNDAAQISINSEENENDTTYYHASKAPGFSFGLTFSRFDLGLATLIDNGSFTLSPNNDFLSYRQWKTSNVGFDVIQFGYRFNSAFKIYISGGFDWTHIRLRDNITILRNQPVLTYQEDDIDYSKNRFSSSYLRIPLSFDFRSHDDARGNRFHFIAGPDIGILLNGRVKQISDENGKQKFNDDYHYTKLRYGVFTRIGYGAAGLFAKYYFNDVFENSPAQKGLKNFSFGITIGW
ncbi:outer membrane beta-barrel protein [Mucilaginibacter segetis]|uniref:Outer membrane beta-barrel protein n=1 Tax=Mucilaginibacter segetis TaxID=2793071 RepID=A0A934ULC0_9SPHI|nr:outer membrane beta-barrel protein [Mucilaginibacter segetis]MBK0377815.1 outer membrane beta-barrel protein [Mucilaginibacter segetis]